MIYLIIDNIICRERLLDAGRRKENTKIINNRYQERIRCMNSCLSLVDYNIITVAVAMYNA
jgi:hypothetical protein